MSSVPLLYRLAVRTARHMAPLFARDGSKLARGLAGRRAAHEVLAAWGERERDPERPTAWFHAPSVGEALQAQAVMRLVQTASCLKLSDDGQGRWERTEVCLPDGFRP